MRGASGRADDGEDRRGAVRAGGAGRWFCLLCRCNHPALPTRSKVNDWEIKRASLSRKQWRDSGRGNWGARKQDPQKEHYIDQSHASAPAQATQNSASKPNREQAESRETNTECWPYWTRRHVPKKEKREHREAKRRRDQKIIARAWRNKRRKKKEIER